MIAKKQLDVSVRFQVGGLHDGCEGQQTAMLSSLPQTVQVGLL
jgi:hypothetical protein